MTESNRRRLLRRVMAGGALAAAAPAFAMTAPAADAGQPEGGGGKEGGGLAEDPAGPVHDVRRYGAAGDGIADDSKPAQAAIDAALKAGGGRVHFPSGRYRMGRGLVVSASDRIDITGDGGSSILLHEEDEPLLLWKESASCRESSVRHLHFSSVKRDKSRGTPVIACLGGAERSFFSHLHFDAPGARMGSGIVVDRVMDTTTLDHVLLWGPVEGTGIRVARGSEVRIIGGRVIGSHRIYETASEASIGIHLVGNNGGVHVVTTDLIALHTCMLIGEEGQASNREVFLTHPTLDSSVHGLRQIDSAYTSVAGCWAASSDEDQVRLEESARGAILVISGGTIFNGGAYGRPGGHNGLVVKAGTFVLSGVTVRHNKGTGILVDGGGVRDYAITGCRIADNGTGSVLDGENYAFTGNVLARNRTGIVDRGRDPKVVGPNALTPVDSGQWTVDSGQQASEWNVVG